MKEAVHPRRPKPGVRRIELPEQDPDHRQIIEEFPKKTESYLPAYTEHPDFPGHLLINQGPLTGDDGQELIRRTYRKLPGPILTQGFVDERDEITGTISRQIVRSDNAVASFSTGQIKEYQPIDSSKILSVQIITSIDLQSLPDEETRWFGGSMRLPDELLSVEGAWSNTQGNSSGVGGVGGSVGVTVAISGDVIIKIKDGHRGGCKSKLVRSFLTAPPAHVDIPAPTIIQTVTGRAWVRTNAASENKRVKLAGAKSSTEASINKRAGVRAVTIGGILTGNYTVVNADDTVTETKRVSAFSSFGSYSLSVTQTAEGVLTVELPTSTPTKFNPGQFILAAVQVEKWRAGIYVMEKIYNKVPFM